MAELTLDHNGHEIRYSENDDLWRCWALGLDAKTLSALKNKINKVDADRRRISVPAIYLSSGYSAENGRPTDVILIDADGKGVWITSEHETWRRGKKGTEIKRHKASPANLVEPTPENRVAIEEWSAAVSAAREASARAERLKEAIPRLSIERLVELGAKAEEAGDA